MVAHESITDFDDLGVRALITTRHAGTLGFAGPDPEADVLGRWSLVERELSPGASAIALPRQVHGTRVIEQRGGWSGFRRVDEADGQYAPVKGVALAVTVADCVPVFLAHESGMVGLLHAGWRGIAGGILREALIALDRAGAGAAGLRVHLGPAICGRCYEVGAEVRAQLTGMPTTRSGHVDLRALLFEEARDAGIRRVTVSPWCTRCDNDRFFSHRAGDAGRQAAVMVACGDSMS